MWHKRVAEHKKSSSLLVAALAVLLFLAGAAISLYPVVSNWMAEIYQADVIQEYAQTVSTENRDFYATEWQKAQEYNENLLGDPVRDPFCAGNWLRIAG